MSQERQVDGRLVSRVETANPVVLDAAYAVCRAIAKREAKNFYYAFVALPKPKRNAICAIYAFMRQADDLADDESMSTDDRRTQLDAWMEAWRAVSADPEKAIASSDLVFVAVRDATVRFQIPLALLDELVAGVTMDLDSSKRDAADTYATFDALYRYCYLVASVVGLVCIRIFGYTDPRAEILAEETGIAFQLTNILRDVAEDAQRNRVYLPLEDLTAHGVTLEALLERQKGSRPTANERALLQDIGRRAEKFYTSAQALMPLIEKESQPALWVLVKIYHALLKRIERVEFDVFSQRVSLPLVDKLGILAVGLMKMGWVRVVG